MGSEGCKYSDIIITPDHLDFETQERPRLNPPAQDIFIKKDGHDLSPSWDAHVTTQGPLIWLKLKPLSGKAPKRVRVFCKSIGMPPGEWSGEIKIEPDSPEVKVTPPVIPVKLTVKGEEPPTPEPRYRLTMAAEEGGVVIDMTNDSPYLEGTEVNIKAEPSEGYKFDGWITPAGSFDNNAAEETIFTMPARNVTVTGRFHSVPAPPPPPPPDKSPLRKFIEWLLGLLKVR
jgi:hypothetical protein